MKRLIAFLLLMSFVLFGVSALQQNVTFLQPMMGTGGIPIVPKRDILGKYPYGPIDYVVDGWTVLSGSDEPFVGKNIPTYGQYSSNEMLCTGGLKNIQGKSFSSIKVDFSATCSNGFFFVSQSNPYYRRPFKLYVIPRVNIKSIGRRDKETIEYTYYGTPIVLQEGKDNRSFFTFTRDPKLSKDYYYDIWFDMVLCLPGEIDNNNNLVDGKMLYPLVVANDYSGLLNLTITTSVDSNPGVSKGIAVPFTGYWGTAVPSVQDSSISMYIFPTSAAGNLNMKDYGVDQKIADIEVLGINNLGSAENLKAWGEANLPKWVISLGVLDALSSIVDYFMNDASDVNYCLFMSSSSDPTVDKGPFRMVRDSAVGNYNADITPHNSIKFTVKLVDNMTNTMKEYTGSEVINLYDLPTYENKNTAKFSKLFVPEGVQNRGTNMSQNNNKSFSFSGSAFINLEDKTNVIMEAGRYVGKIYVHVIALDIKK